MMPKYVNSSTESTVLPSTIIGDGVDPKPRFWSFVLVQETQRPNLEASSSIAVRAVRKLYSLSTSRATSSA